ncbi:MAG: DUF1565 domain-containing protein, partial [bacterium]|nr:DUF1565 domain-containing protein [bacterium]
YGSGLSSTGRIVNNIVVGNEATSLGGGVRLSNSSSVELVNNTIAANTGDGISMDAGGATLTNNIVSHNTGYGIREEDSTADPATLASNNIHSNGLGPFLDEGVNAIHNVALLNGFVAGASGNIDVDPQYVAGPVDAVHTDDDYRLLDSSACIDAGDDGAEVPVDDIDGDVRPYDFAGVDNNGAALDFDIGADEFFIPSGDVTAPVFAGLESAAGGADQVCLAWSEAIDPSRPVLYSIYRATTSGGQNFTTPTATTYGLGLCDGSVIAGTTYCYVVRAEDYSGNPEANTVEHCATPGASEFWVDVVSGSNVTGDGSSGTPWRHVTYALTQVDAPATIRVRPGTYDTTVDPSGYSEIFPIRLEDGVSLVSTDGFATTILDAQGTARVVDAVGVGAATRLEGLTITGGSVSGHGAGVWINNSSIEVRDNRITGNQTAGSQSGELGGGIYVNGTSTPWIVDNEITANIADGSNAGYGGGIAVSGSGTAATRIEGNTISGNTCGNASNVYGAGIYAGTGAEIRDNVITGNVLTGSTRYGGGIYAVSKSIVVGNMVVDNTGATYGGGIYTVSLTTEARIENNVVVGNAATLFGGGMRLTGSASIPVANNTVSYNTGDGISMNTSGATFLNNIVSHNTAYGVHEEDSTADPALLRYNDIYLNSSGAYNDEGTTVLADVVTLQGAVPEATDNIEVDPLFVSPEDDADHTDDDYHLQSGSGCVDAGWDGAEVPVTDIDGDARAFDAAGVDNNGPLWEFDIGADEWIGTDTLAPLFDGLEEARPGDTFVDLLWSVAFDSSGPIVYDVYVRTTAESHDFGLPDFTTSDPFFQVTGLTNGVTYFFVVKARDALGQRDGNLVELSATPAINALPGVFVDRVFGSDATGDGSFGNPWRHITYALTQVSGPETIQVRPGTYDATIDGEGFGEVFPIPLADGVSVLATGGASVTTIDAQGVAGVLRADGIAAGTRLEGFTITGGDATGQGGGIYLVNASLEIRDNVITGNQVQGSSSGSGGGLYIVGTSSAIVENNEISDNLSDGSNSAFGGGIFISGSGTSGSRVEGNTIAGNRCGFASTVYGGGIYVSSSAEIRDNLIDGNVLEGSTKYGGGIYASGAAVRLFGNRIFDHAGVSYGGGILGSGLSSFGRIVNNIVAGNEATIAGGGIRLQSSSSVELVNNTVAYNTGDGISFDTSGAVLTSNIVSDNSGYGMREEDTSADPLSILNNNVYQNTAGLYFDEGATLYATPASLEANVPAAAANIAVDPGYVAPENDTDHGDDDYRLLDTSACIDAAHDGLEVPADDIDGDSRPYDFSGVDNNGATLDYDIGADEFFIPAGDVTAPVFGGLEAAVATTGQVCLDWSEAEDDSRPVLYRIYRAETPGGQNFGTPTTTTYRTDHCDTGLSSATTYCYVVRALDYSSNGETNTTEVCGTTP